MHDIPEAWGTAVNIQSMVFGNMGETSATGVAFTRNPSNGENRLYGEFLINAQGEDVVAGIRTPQSLTKPPARRWATRRRRWKRRCRWCSPSWSVVETLERHYTRHAGHRVHGGAGHALHAADSQRQAHRQGRAEDRRRHGRRRRDLQDRGDQPRRAGLAGPTAAPDHRPDRPSQRHRRRPAGLARCGLRQDRLRQRRRGEGRRRRRERHPGARSKPRPRTSTACTRRGASSPPAVA
jgi:hypothetical protein